MLSLCLRISVPSQYFVSFLSEGQCLALISNVWQGEKTNILPRSHLQVGVILWRGTAIRASFCWVFAGVNREETSFKEPVLAAITLQLSIALRDHNWRLEDKVGLGQAAIASKLSSMERSCLQKVGCDQKW